jgi:hypothetical protein
MSDLDKLFDKFSHRKETERDAKHREALEEQAAREQTTQAEKSSEVAAALLTVSDSR